MPGSLTHRICNPTNGSYEHHDFDFMGAILARTTAMNERRGVLRVPTSSQISDVGVSVHYGYFLQTGRFWSLVVAHALYDSVQVVATVIAIRAAGL